MTAPRINQYEIYESFSSGFITAILGPRRVGKTSLVKAYVDKHPEYTWVLLNCDDFELRRKLSQQNVLQEIVVETAGQHITAEKKIWVVIDEVQKCPECFEQIKILYDTFKDKNAIKFILTGSALLELHRLSAETLAGRIALFYLAEFSLQESIALQQHLPLPKQSIMEMLFNNEADMLTQTITALSPLKPKLLDGLSEQLIWGGLPEVLQLDTPQQKTRYLSNYLQTYLEKDVRPITNITNLELYRHLLDVLAEQTGSVRDDTKLLESLHCARDTLKKYRAILSATLIYHELYPYITSSIKRIVKSPKGYLTNNGLITYLTGIDSIMLLEKTNTLGHRFENWLLKELQIVLARKSHRSTLHYWRLSNGKEIDFVVDYKPFILPIEVTYSTRIQPKKVATLTHFLSHEPKAPYAIYLYMGTYQWDPKHRIHYLPAWCVC